MNHRCKRAQKAAITDTFLLPYCVRVQLQTKEDDNFLILSTLKANVVEKQNSVTPNAAPSLSPVHSANVFVRRAAFPRFSRDLPQLQCAQSLRFVPGHKHCGLMQPFTQGSRGFTLSEQCCACNHLQRESARICI